MGRGDLRVNLTSIYSRGGCVLDTALASEACVYTRTAIRTSETVVNFVALVGRYEGAGEGSEF